MESDIEGSRNPSTDVNLSNAEIRKVESSEGEFHEHSERAEDKMRFCKYCQYQALDWPVGAV